MAIQFSVSLMCMDLLHVGEQLAVLNNRADLYHIDIMDGHYCKNITLSPDFIKSIHPVTTLPMDVHLMTTQPDDWIEVVAKAGAHTISPHAETINSDAFRIINKIKALGCGVGITLNPATPLSYINHYIELIDTLTIMTVDVGYAGQPFITAMLDKIAEAKALREQCGYHYKIQIDGSCNQNTFGRLYEAGADIFILGSSGLFGLDRELNTAYDKMLKIYEEQVKPA